MAYATCRFPFVDEWKKLGDRNKFIAFIDSVLSGFGQIAFSDNPLSGLILIIGCFVGSIEVAISGLFAAIVATAIAYAIGTPDILIRMGLYTFNGALAGLGMALFVFPGQPVTFAMLLYSAIVAILCVLLTSAISKVFSNWSVPGLALPYCTTLLIMVPASLLMGNFEVSTSLIPHMGELASGTGAFAEWTVSSFFTAVFNSMAEIIWQANVASGVLYLIAVMLSSRIDALSAVFASITATLVAIAFGMQMDSLLIGIYGYNAILVMQALFGRGYKMSVSCFFVSWVLALVTIVVTAWMQVLFAPLGAAVCAFPYVIISVLAMLARDSLGKLHFVDPLKWGVPETIAATLKEEDLQKEKASSDEK